MGATESNFDGAVGSIGRPRGSDRGRDGLEERITAPDTPAAGRDCRASIRKSERRS